MKKFSISYALALMGFTTIIIQVILIRELILSFSGNELSIGIFLSNWLILEATGSYIAGRYAVKLKSIIKPFVLLQGIIALIFPLILYLNRYINSGIGSVPGEGVDIISIFGISFLLLFPLGLSGGAQFSFGCRLIPLLYKNQQHQAGRVYFFEALGSILGGFSATYLFLDLLNPDQTVYVIAFLNIISALFLMSIDPDDKNLFSFRKNSFLKIFHLGLLLALLILLFFNHIQSLQFKTISMRWPDYQLLSSKNSVYGNITILKRADQYEVMSNGVPAASLPTPDISSVEDFAHLSLLFHPKPQKVFLIGGGFKGLLDEIRKHPVVEIDYAEIDPLLIEMIEIHIPVADSARSMNSNINILYLDGRYYLKNTDKKYDLILMYLPDPSTLELNRFYTIDFMQICHDRLNEGGLLIFQIPAGASYMSDALIKLHKCILNTVSEEFKNYRVLPGMSNLVIASDNQHLDQIEADEIIERFEDRKIKTRSFSEEYINFRLDRLRIDWYREELQQISTDILNTDLNPRALYYDLVYWHTQFSPQFASIFAWLENITEIKIVLFIIFTFLILFIVQHRYKTSRPNHIYLVIFTSGFCGMALTVLMVLLFQSLFGYVFYWIGMILSAFMTGLALGSWRMSKSELTVSQGKTKLYISEVLFVFYFGIVLLLLMMYNVSGLNLIPALFIRSFILFITAICGYLIGAQFPLANILLMQYRTDVSKTGGVLYAVDLIGAWAGGIVVTLVLIPVVGIIETCLALFLIKIGSMLLFRVFRLAFESGKTELN